ncbi:MAG: DUF3732 domain-containing protein [Bacteroidales bacterium]|jgi:ABC-type phosphate transport system auxiliary subunit|nr:DUF3732 domain-containing protein [Bacteroidales bacterium]
MKSYIKALVIFNDKGEKRTVPLKQGVNIVTGESKTGKSALVEIIDYCLCSARCTIPKGKITDFSCLYSLVMNINDNTYIIARLNWNEGGKMYVSKESVEFEPDSLELNYFEDKSAIPYKEAQYEIECALGLFVTNMSTDSEQQGKKASLRNMVSYLFQHQNLMASKFALFYRFSDYYKRKDIIDQFPVFAGMISQEYYSDLIQLNNFKVQLKQKHKKQKVSEKSTAYIKENLSPLLKDYHALLEQNFDSDITAQKMLKLAVDLPQFDDSQLFGESRIAARYSELKEELESLRNEEREVFLKIKNIDNASNTGNTFSNMLKELKQQTSVAEIETNEYVCPLCGNDCNEIAENDSEIIEAADWLDNELTITEKYTADFSEDVRKLKDAHSQIESKIREVWKQKKTIEEKYISSKSLVSKREKVNYAKARIALYAEMSDSGIFETVDEDIEELKNKIKMLEEKIRGFDVDAKMSKAQAFLSDNMNRLALTLDFEDEYKPIDLNFGLTDGSFDIYQLQNNREKIHLYEMGSGANWVSCHIALFLSFLHYFTQQKNSPMPLFLFFDQPSQVYFPQGNENDTEVSQSDIIAVNKMYKTIFDEINKIGETTGLLPQILIVDHVDGHNLEIKDEFTAYIRCDWRNGEALI